MAPTRLGGALVCECGWRVVAIDAFPSGLVTATPPTPLRRGGGGGARTCATRRSIRRVARKGVGFGVWSARTEEKASLPPRLFLLPLRWGAKLRGRAGRGCRGGPDRAARRRLHAGVGRIRHDLRL
eukprot:scaffold10253_cov124-Isochrysis_galbana.AAC.18